MTLLTTAEAAAAAFVPPSTSSEQVDCRACGASWPEADYRRLTLILVSEAKGA
jgi:hypothetical protein